MNCGAWLILNVSTGCGLSPNAFQIRPTVDFDAPLAAAIDARDQCVAFLGCRSRVATITSWACSSVIVRGSRTPFFGQSVEATFLQTAAEPAGVVVAGVRAAVSDRAGWRGR